MDQLAIAIKLLLDDSEERFTYERQLRMFQFQCWLLDTWKQERSFRRSAIRFGGAALSREISRSLENGVDAREIAFLLVVVSKNMEEIINHCFATRNNIYALLSVDRFSSLKEGPR